MAFQGTDPSYNGNFLIDVTRTNFSALNSATSGLYGYPYDQSTLSFQDAISPFEIVWTKARDEVQPSIYLFTDGCDNGGVQNCTMSCLDKNVAFSTPSTFHNCMAYPMVAKIYSDGNITANTQDSVLLDTLKIQKSPEDSALLNDITQIMEGCLQSLCEEFPACEGIIAETNYPSVFNSTSAFFSLGNETNAKGASQDYEVLYGVTRDLSELTNYLCDLQIAGLDSDVGGIGIFISYWIQSGLAVLGCLAVLWWKWGLRCCSFIVYSLGFRYRTAKEYSRSFAENLGNKHLPATSSALVEFQKAQCFFMLAINIAAQVNRGKGGFQPTSLQQLYNNYVLIKAISISGFLPITFTLFTLHTVDMVSWYVIVLSVLTVAISTSTLVNVGTFSPGQADMDYLFKHSTTGGPTACGNSNMLAYCLDHPSSDYGILNANYAISAGTDPSGSAYGILGFCLIVLILLILNQAKVLKKLSSLRMKPSFSKTQNFLIHNFVGIRGIQLALATILCILEGLQSSFFLFPAFELLCLLYVFIVSDLHYTARKNAAGKIYNKWAVLFADLFAFGVSFGDCIIRSSILFVLSVILWSTFTSTLILTSIHVHKVRKSQLRRKKAQRQHPIFLRWMSAIVLLGWRRAQSMFLDAQSSAFASRMSRLKRNLKSAMNASNSTMKLTPSIVFLFYVIFFALYIYWFAIYFTDLSWFGDRVDFNTWTFGQIVAITVWAQPLCEYFYLELSGMRRGFQHRLLWPYRVVIQEKDEETAQDAAKNPAPVDEAEDTTARRDSQERLIREAADSTAPFTTSTPMASAVSQALPDENSIPAPRVDGTPAESHLHQHEDVELASLSEERNLHVDLGRSQSRC